MSENWVPEVDGQITATSVPMTPPPAGTVVGSDVWWLHRLLGRAAAERPHLLFLDNYMAGRHRLAFASDKFRATFGGLFQAFADNWCPIVVDACEERLNVEGFRWGDETTADKPAWELWQRNELDAESQIGHVEAMIARHAFVLVEPPAEGEVPRITLESAKQMTVEYAAGTRHTIIAALKQWEGDDGRVHVVLYLPDHLTRWRSKNPAQDMPNGVQVSELQPRVLEGEEFAAEANPLGFVPIVVLPNRPRLLIDGRSEIADVIPMQNAANKFLADMLVAAEYGAFRQRHITGYEPERNPETGERVKPFNPTDRVWLLKKGEFGEFSETNLQNYVQAIELCVQHIASQTRTPPHYFYLKGQFPSGESIKSAETGLVAKVRRKQRHFGESWERVMRMAFLVMGDTAKANEAKVETIWADPESRSEAAHIDALVKMKELGIHPKILWEKAGLSQVEIQRNEELLAGEPVVEEEEPDARPELTAV